MYVRVGSVNHKVNEETIIALERNRRNISFDEAPVYDLTLEQLGLQRFRKDYKTISGKSINAEKVSNLGWTDLYNN